MIKKILLAIAAVLVIAILTLSLGRQADPFPEASESAKWHQTGPEKVRQNNFVVIDNKRKTQAHGEFTGSDSRKFELTVWYPSNLEKGKHPLVVYSHGFSSMRTGGKYLAENLASHGYIVLSTNYPSTNINAPGGPLVKDVVNQPRDISFLLDQILKPEGEMGSLFAKAIDINKIGVMGISLGGMTSTLVSFHPETRDKRVKAAISIAGPASMFAENFYLNANIPYMMIGGNIDALVSYKGNADLVPTRVKNSWLVTIKNASHTGFADAARYLRWLNNPDSIGCNVVLDKLNSEGEEESWYHLIGTPEQGIIYDSKTPLCEQAELPAAMNPLRQHMLTQVVVTAFFTANFSEDSEQRIKALEFLSQKFAKENHEVSVIKSAL